MLCFCAGVVVASPVEDYFLHIDGLPVGVCCSQGNIKLHSPGLPIWPAVSFVNPDCLISSVSENFGCRNKSPKEPAAATQRMHGGPLRRPFDVACHAYAKGHVAIISDNTSTEYH